MLEIRIPVILASGSPRRKELLSKLLAEFRVLPAHVDEEAMTHADPDRTAQLLAEEKARAVAAIHPESLVIGADTVVTYQHGDSHVQLAKPVDIEDAVRMLMELSGRKHRVLTGVAIAYGGQIRSFVCSTTVSFRELSEDEARAYAATGEPMDKAGAYAVQGGGFDFVLDVVGSFTNVIGLPMESLEENLRGFVKEVLST